MWSAQAVGSSQAQYGASVGYSRGQRMRRFVISAVLLVAVVSFVVATCSPSGAPPPTQPSAERLEDRRAPSRARVERTARSTGADNSGPDTASPDQGDASEPASAAAIPTVPLELTFHDSETWARLRVDIREPAELDGSSTLRQDRAWMLDAPVSAGRLDLVLDVTPPEGYVPREVRLNARISPFATGMRAAIAVRPAARVLVRVVDERGVPVAGARVARGESSGSSRDAFGVTDARGELRPRDVPFARGRRLSFRAATDGARSRVVEATLTHVAEDLEVLLALRPTADIEDVVIKDAMVSDHNETDNDLQHEEAAQHPRIRLDVRRRDGRPAGGVGVQVEHRSRDGVWVAGSDVLTDSFGRATIDAPVEPRTYRVTATAVGFVPTTQEITLPAGRSVESVTVHEVGGRHVLVRVTDVDGKPAPFARIFAWTRHGRFHAMDGDCQLIRLHTDARGELMLANTPVDDLMLTARYADRSARKRVEDGEVAELRLVR